jgi:hypothetical protein
VSKWTGFVVHLERPLRSVEIPSRTGRGGRGGIKIGVRDSILGCLDAPSSPSVSLRPLFRVVGQAGLYLEPEKKLQAHDAEDSTVF